MTTVQDEDNMRDVYSAAAGCPKDEGAYLVARIKYDQQRIKMLQNRIKNAGVDWCENERRIASLAAILTESRDRKISELTTRVAELEAELADARSKVAG